MRQSELFTKTRKEGPKDETSKNASLLVRAGFISKEMAGVYSYLPLGLRVLKKIENIIRQEMEAIGGQEVLLTSLQDPRIWKQSGRWNDEVMDIWFKTKLKSGGELGIANTHEEPLTEILKNHIQSHRDLPIYIYQFQTKFRNELRAKSGILRCREFLMKDLYSFSKTEKEFRDFYEKCAKAYIRIFKRTGIGHLTYRTLASGGSFTQGFTDEFQVLTEAGEDIIFIDQKKKIAINKEVYSDKSLKRLNLKGSELVERKAVEVGNIFPLGTRYSEALGLKYKDKEGKEEPVIMGSYGIGLGRLMGTVAETLSDENGLCWPEEIAPFKVQIVSVGEDRDVMKESLSVYKKLSGEGVEVLYDDRNLSPGEKFKESDLLGIPWRVVISRKTLSEKKLELKDRKMGKVKNLSFDQLLKNIK